MHPSFRVAAPLALLFVAAPSLARAQSNEPGEDAAAGSVAVPPESPTFVPPPPPAPAAGSEGTTVGTGTTSSGVVVDDSGLPRGRRSPRYVAYEQGRLVLRDPSGVLELSPQGLLQFVAPSRVH